MTPACKYLIRLQQTADAVVYYVAAKPIVRDETQMENVTRTERYRCLSLITVRNERRESDLVVTTSRNSSHTVAKDSIEDTCRMHHNERCHTNKQRVRFHFHLFTRVQIGSRD